MSCQPWLSPQQCPEAAVKAQKIHSIIFLCFTVVASIFFFASFIRRAILLREPLNTFWVMAVQILLWTPSHIIYFALYIDMVNHPSHHNNLPLMSFCNWFNFTTLGATFGPLIAAWLQLSSKKRLTARKLKADWPWPLVVAVLIFYFGTVITSVLSGYQAFYNYTMRVTTGIWTFYLWICSACLFYGAYKIKQHIKTLPVGKKASRKKGKDEEEMIPPPTPKDSVKRVGSSLNRVLLFVVIGLFLPASIGTLLHSIGLTYIDENIWATHTVWSLYRFCATAYVVFWGATFWAETSYKYNSRTSHTPTPGQSLPVSGSAR